MKKLVSLSLALILSLSLAACGGGGTAASPAPETQAPETPDAEAVELIVFAAASMTETLRAPNSTRTRPPT